MFQLNLQPLIDITPYQHKLRLAEEWMAHKIDGTLPLIGNNGTEVFFIDIGAIPKISWEKAISIYDQTGVLFWNSNVPNNMHPTSFEEYYENQELFSINLK